jgi:vancomycin resistance protein YoaR
MEKKFAHAQAQLASRAAIMLQIGAAEKLYMAAYPGIGAFTFRLGEYSLAFDEAEGKPYDEDALNAMLAELDARIFKAKKDAEFAISLIEAWGA